MTSPSTIFFASERGANLGHLGRDLALAREFKSRGHRVVLAVPDLRAAQAFVGQHDFVLLQAPVLRLAEPRTKPSANFAEMLLNLGFSDAKALHAATEAWLTLFRSTRPSFIIYNNAPTALIAARIAKLPVRLIGTAFEIPPAAGTLPNFGLESDEASGNGAQIEMMLVERINEELARHDAPLVQRIADMYPAKDVHLTTLQELDPFGPRHNISYVGPIFECGPQHEVDWHRPEDVHVFAYLRARVPGCEAMLTALQSSQAEVICMMPDCPPEWVGRFDRIRFFKHPVLLAFVLPKAQLVVTCGVGLVTTSLLCAVPVLFMPQTVEQHLIGRAAARTGAVAVVASNRTREEFATQLAASLDNGVLRKQAMAFATRYMPIKFENNADGVSAAVEAVISGAHR